MTLKKILFFVLLLLPLLFLSSCIYKMPDEDTASLIPLTNNPKVYQDNSPSMPVQGGF